MFDTLTDLVEHYKLKGIEEISGNWVYFRQVSVCWRAAFSFHLNSFHKQNTSGGLLIVWLFPQPYYSTRVNAGDIGSRVKQLDETREKQLEGEGEKSKAGFWEEFDVRFYLTSYDVSCGVRTTVNITLQSRRPLPALPSAKE